MRIIDCTVQDEYIVGDGAFVGASGSHDDVALRLTFGDMWEGKHKIVQFTDALGTETVERTLIDAMKDADGAYIVPIPYEAKRYPGEISATVKGAVMNDETDPAEETCATLAVRARFIVKDSGWDEDAAESHLPTPSDAELILSQAVAAADSAAGSARDAAGSAASAAAAEHGADLFKQASQNAMNEAARSQRDAAASATAAAASAQDAARDRHTHENKSVLDAITSAVKSGWDRLVTLFASITAVVSTLGSDDTTIPTSKAVKDALAGKVSGVRGIGQSGEEESFVDANGIAHIPMVVSSTGKGKRPGMIWTWTSRYATAANDDGVLVAQPKTVRQFYEKQDGADVLHDNAFISKGTLKNLMGNPESGTTIATSDDVDRMEGQIADLEDAFVGVVREDDLLSENYAGWIGAKNGQNASTVQTELDRAHVHRDRRDNPHEVTAAQIGALPTSHRTEDHAHAAGKIDYTQHYEIGEEGKETNAGKALDYKSEGYASEIFFEDTGWKRVWCGMRSLNGRLGMSLTYNAYAKGRVTQNLMLEIAATAKYATNNYPSPGTPIENVGTPQVWQVSNVVCGEDVTDTRYPARQTLIDKVRIVGIPGTSDVNNKMVCFVDVHIVNRGNPTDGYSLLNSGNKIVQLKLNWAGKSWNNSVFPIYEEIKVNDLSVPYTFINNKVEVTETLEQQALIDVDFEHQISIPSTAPAKIEKLTLGQEPSGDMDAAPKKYVDDGKMKYITTATVTEATNKLIASLTQPIKDATVYVLAKCATGSSAKVILRFYNGTTPAGRSIGTISAGEEKEAVMEFSTFGGSRGINITKNTALSANSGINGNLLCYVFKPGLGANPVDKVELEIQNGGTFAANTKIEIFGVRA